MRAAEIKRTLSLEVPMLILYPNNYTQVVVTRPGTEPHILIEITHHKNGMLEIKHDKTDLIPSCISVFDDDLHRSKGQIMPVYTNGYIVYCEKCRRNFTEESIKDVETTLDRYDWSYRTNEHNTTFHNKEYKFKDIICLDCQSDIQDDNSTT